MSTDDEMQPAPPAALPESAAMQQRYGRTARRRFRGRLIAWVAGAGVAVVIAAWVVWAGLDGTSATVDTQDTAHTVIDSRSVEVEFDLTVPRGATASCAVQALSEKFAVVGWKIIDVPSSDQATRSFSETVRTSELASTGLIYDCWLT
ncbi:DUF4307 domain-containing protein [Herbiconiux sp. CPCC 205763]|uniref:DUF4307 domain-containing protein n=1 Tax=Herbiconiux aconitum TaxID=2970913 RepID=A0ABT2GS26_9MICO|nr:DUF4307 domain-containing protein [Herbiconiux aconitum]MCS5719023.1 DUF4307 domain-containing protein [Herbiconiux aconitum]